MRSFAWVACLLACTPQLPAAMPTVAAAQNPALPEPDGGDEQALDVASQDGPPSGPEIAEIAQGLADAGTPLKDAAPALPAPAQDALAQDALAQDALAQDVPTQDVPTQDLAAKEVADAAQDVADTAPEVSAGKPDGQPAAPVCDPAAKPLPNAALSEAAGDGGCGKGMVAIEKFCIDRWEAALVDVASGKSWSPFWNPGKLAVRAVAIAGAVPQGYISGTQAKAACLAAGKRLCTDSEWLRACRGPQKSTYPYGNTLKPGVCNDSRAKHPAVEYFATSASWIWSQLGHPCLAQLPDTVDKAGQNAGCVAAEGVFDLMGNVHEWTADPAGTFRGGFYVDTKLNGPGCLYATTAHTVSHWDYSTGFRCCADKL